MITVRIILRLFKQEDVFVLIRPMGRQKATNLFSCLGEYVKGLYKVNL